MALIIMIYAVLSYGLFLAVSVWMALFLLDAGALRSSAPTSTWPVAATVDIVLISLFGLVHSIMARPGFKRMWTRVVPPAAERATYVLQSSLLLALVFHQWQPINATIWHVEGGMSYAILAVFYLGLGIIVLATFLLGHSNFTGLQQAWDNLKLIPERKSKFRTPMLYQIVRHPLQLGIVMAMFAVPHISADGLLFAVVMLTYILIGLHFEEQALLREFGGRYAVYMKSVPMLLPRLRFPIAGNQPRKRRIKPKA
ncbi:MAG: hypothetical protein KUG62_11310 [Rhodobacteraceae bacterium]|nr:hypothetical protein [Paracoccaceae bacterium]